MNDHSEQCSIEENFLNSTPLQVGDNIRIINKENNEFCAFKIQRTHSEDGNEEWIRMGLPARNRFYSGSPPDSFDAEITYTVTSPFVNSREQAKKKGEMYDNHYISPTSNIASTAPHGGLVELNTGKQAKYTAELLDSSYWYTQAYGGVNGAFDRWHITSTDISPRGFPGLSHLDDNKPFKYVISYQGFSGSEIVVGGRAPLELREKIAEGLEVNTSYSSVVVGKNTGSGSYDNIDGDSAGNYANQISEGTGNSIQIEQPYNLRDNNWKKTSEIVAKAIFNYTQ